MANLAEKCQHEIFLDAFGEECIQDADVHYVTCFDVCKMNPQLVDITEEPRILFDTINVVRRFQKRSQNCTVDPWFFFAVDIRI